MKTRVDRALREEAARFGLRYACEHCAHFEEGQRTCAEGFPNAAHRDTPIDRAPDLEFCKSFELG
jgi:hypothetical protein